MSFSIGSRLIGRPARCLFDRPGEVVLPAYSDDVFGFVPGSSPWTHPYLASGGAEAMISPPGIFVDGTPEVSATAGELVGKSRQERFDSTQETEHRDRF
jgi:hypothetical protein